MNEHEVVLVWETTHGRSPAQAAVGAGAIVVLEPAQQQPGAIRRRVIRLGVRPLAQRGLDEPLGLAVGPRRIRSRAAMVHVQRAADGTRALPR